MTKIPRPVTVDFETFPIEDRPRYPPVPVGVSIQYPGKAPRYYAWGHPTENNCTWAEAREALAKAWQHKDGLLFHNAKFDLDVAEVHMGLEIPAWQRIHDTLFLLFLEDPHQKEIGLKPSAARLLDIPPEERDLVVDWLIEHQPIPGVRLNRGRNGERYAGAYVAFAPGKLVGDYANGDVERTSRLFELLWERVVVTREMAEAYDTERELMLILLDMERWGVRVDHERLRADVAMYTSWMGKLDAWILKRLGTSELNIDSGDQLAAAMIAKGKADPALMGITATGKVATNKDALKHGVTDKVLGAVLKYRSQLKTCLNTFMIPWLEMADASGGFIYTTWNQTKSPDGGTRTGRLSSTPNFQNIPKEFAAIFEGLKRPWPDLPPLPLVRGYVIPYNDDEVLLGRDYCFSPDTEVLTEKGFQRFDQLDRSLKLAQWAAGKITFDHPLEHQELDFVGNLIHVVGSRSTDLLMTPNHRCVLFKERTAVVFPAERYPSRGFKQPHAGLYEGSLPVQQELVCLVAAFQADATSKSGSAVWKLKKLRKVERLRALLDAVKVPWRMAPTTDGMTTISVRWEDLPSGFFYLIDHETKTFRRTLTEVKVGERFSFLCELGFWDGRRQNTSWSYFTTHQGNADLVAELAAITGLRSTSSQTRLKSGKLFTTVNLRFNSSTWVDTFKKTEVPYAGKVYCASMPEGTLVVRRNGKVCVTGNSQQEPRILAHFEDGVLAEQYNADPWLDFHDNAKAYLEEITGRKYERKPVKNINLGLIYGQGVGSLAIKNESTVEETADIKAKILAMYPGLKSMYQDMKRRSIAKEPIRTWGGREYYCEEPAIVKGRIMTFDYKMVNYLIQGSASDCTKQAMIRYAREAKRLKVWGRWKLLLQVHDEIVSSAPKGQAKAAMELLKASMESVEFDVPMLSEGEWGSRWVHMNTWDKKGKVADVF